MFGLEPRDPSTALLALVALLVIAGMASLLPARRTVASIEDEAVIERILDHLGRASEALDLAHPSRGPPDGELPL